MTAPAETTGAGGSPCDADIRVSVSDPPHSDARVHPHKPQRRAGRTARDRGCPRGWRAPPASPPVDERRSARLAGKEQPRQAAFAIPTITVLAPSGAIAGRWRCLADEPALHLREVLKFTEVEEEPSTTSALLQLDSVALISSHRAVTLRAHNRRPRGFLPRIGIVWTRVVRIGHATNHDDPSQIIGQLIEAGTECGTRGLDEDETGVWLAQTPRNKTGELCDSSNTKLCIDTPGSRRRGWNSKGSSSVQALGSDAVRRHAGGHLDPPGVAPHFARRTRPSATALTWSAQCLLP